MKKTDIKVGERYAVVARYTQRQSSAPIAATVAALDVARTYRPRSGWHEKTAHDGVLVTFDQPVVHGSGNSFETLEERIARVNDEAGQKARQEAFTKTVITTREVVELWSERERREEEARQHRANTDRADNERADAFEAGELAEKVALFEAAGLNPRVQINESRRDGAWLVFDGGALKLSVGTWVNRPVGFASYPERVTINKDALLALVERVAELNAVQS